MKKIILFSILVLAFASCKQQTNSKERSNPMDWQWQVYYDYTGLMTEFDSVGFGNYYIQSRTDYNGIYFNHGDTLKYPLFALTHFNCPPSQAGNSGKVLGTNGTQVSWVSNGSGEVYYNNGSLISAPKNYTGTSTTTTGVATFYLTTNGLSSGTAIYANVYNVIPIVNDASTNYTYAWSYNAGTKALTVTSKYSPGLVVGLLTLLGLPQNVPNGTSVNVSVKGN